ncbi:MAG: hypothetical protein WDM89_22690 [Rhizomicrobium sp.]
MNQEAIYSARAQKKLSGSIRLQFSTCPEAGNDNGMELSSASFVPAVVSSQPKIMGIFNGRYAATAA